MSLKYQVCRDNNTLKYYRHGIYHRVNSPSDIRESGAIFWEQYGVFHRNDGPATLLSYYLRGKIYSKPEYESKISNTLS